MHARRAGCHHATGPRCHEAAGVALRSACHRTGEGVPAPAFRGVMPLAAAGRPAFTDSPVLRASLAVRTEPFVIATGRLERRDGVINVVVQSLRSIERPDLPRADVRQIEPPAGRETGREEVAATASGPVAAGAGSLRAVLPTPHSFGRRGR